MIDFLLAWLLISIALAPAVLLGDLTFVLLSMALNGHQVRLRDWIDALLLTVAFSLPFMLLFAILAGLFIPFRRWIVSRRFPFIRLGYLAVVAFGPFLLSQNAWQYGWTGDDWRRYAMWVTVYEVIALAATLLFVLLVNRSLLGVRLRAG